MATRSFGSFANHEVFDFNPGDSITFGATFKASKLVLKEQEGNLLLTYGAKSITLTTFALADITPSSFVFADGSLVLAGTAGADTVDGGSFDDLIFGLAGADQLTGGAGADFLSGGNAVDKLTGGGGNDTLDGGSGGDSMNGGMGSDSFVIDALGDTVTELADSLAGAEDVDTATELVNDDTLDANVENMILGNGILKGTGNVSGNTITGNNAANQLFGMGGIDNLVGKAGDDLLDGGAGADVMNGAGGDDTYVIDRNADAIMESSGNDTAQIAAGDGFNLTSLADGVENLDASMVLGAHSYTLNGLDNSFTGSVGVVKDTVDGGEGDDSLSGGGGSDSLTGGGGYGNDTLNGGAGADTLTGGMGDDTYVLNTLSDVVLEDLGAGTDTVSIVGGGFTSYSVYGGPLENIDASAAGGPGLTLFGGSGANTLTGSAGMDFIQGYGGSDSIAGGGGNDSIRGQRTDDLSGVADTLDGGAGDDTMNGGYGDDVYVVDSAADQVTEAFASMGNDTVRIVGSSIVAFDLGAFAGGVVENVDGSAGECTDFTGNAAANIIIGSAGSDTIDATQGGGDDLSGGYGNDSITSGAAAKHFDDTLDGGAGDDTLAGGYGSDTYVIDSNADLISHGGLSADGSEGLGDGTDTVRIEGSAINTFALYTELENLDASGSSYGGAIMHLAGNASNNILTGSGVNDSIVGNGGNDDLHGGNGDDALYAGSGNDLLDGGAGFDYLQGGTGDDTYVVDQNGELTSINTNEDSVHGGGHDTLRIAASNSFNGAITLLASLEDLDASESGSSNVLYGNVSNNHIIGSSFGESIFGDTGIDSIEGGDGNDSLYDDFSYGGGFGISGGAGFDIVKTADGQDVDFRPFADSISGVEAIWMLNDANGNLITLESSDVIAMSDTDTLTIYGGSDDSLSAGAEAGAWNFDSTDGAYNYYSLNGATLKISAELTQHDLVAT